MNKFISCFSLLLISIFATPSFAGDHELVEYLKIEWEGFFKSYQFIVDCFGNYLNSGEIETITDIISYDVRQTQIAFFKDGFIITFLGGENEGKQIVVCQDKIIGVSYPCEKRGLNLIHLYVWGRVYSSFRKVEVDIENVPLFQYLIEEGKY